MRIHKVSRSEAAFGIESGQNLGLGVAEPSGGPVFQKRATNLWTRCRGALRGVHIFKNHTCFSLLLRFLQVTPMQASPRSKEAGGAWSHTISVDFCRTEFRSSRLGRNSAGTQPEIRPSQKSKPVNLTRHVFRSAIYTYIYIYIYIYIHIYIHKYTCTFNAKSEPETNV